MATSKDTLISLAIKQIGSYYSGDLVIKGVHLELSMFPVSNSFVFTKGKWDSKIWD